MSSALTSRHLRRRIVGGALALALAGAASAVGMTSASAVDPNTDAASATDGVDASSAILQLVGAPLSTSTSVDRLPNGKVKTGGTKTQKYKSDLAAQRNAVKSWLRTYAPKAKVTGEYDYALNAIAVRLGGTPLSVLRSAPGVASVAPQFIYHPTAVDPDLARIDALAGWAASGATSVESDPTTWAGYGVKVGIIDSGIDVRHPCFSDAGFPAMKQLGDSRFTNNKVIVARVFNNKAGVSGYTAQAIGSHGTHVSGTVACDLLTPAVVDGAAIPYDPSGVAPGARLGSYNVFPGPVENARSEDILNAIQAAVDDGMDVLNMSLGGDAHGAQDLLTQAVDNVDLGGVVVAISAGNDGPGYATTGSPGSAERALTAGASSVGHFVGTPIRTASGAEVTVAAIGELPTPAADLTAPLAVVANADGTLGTACAALPAGSLTGSIALISRGACTFGSKVSRAQAAGAVAVIIVNNVPGDPIAMAADAAFTSTIPAVMAPLSAKSALTALAGSPVTIVASARYTSTGNDDILAAFSSVGPVDVTYRVKPDVVAPGVNILSSVPLADCAGSAWVATYGCWAFYQGTSMASPHLAGMAAVVRDAHPTWAPWQVRSAIVNTAKQNGVMKTLALTLPETDVQRVGSGLADLDAAVGASLVISSPSVSFGPIPNGSGQTRSATVTVTNVSGSAVTAPVSVEDSTGSGTFSASATSVSLAAGASTTVTVSFTAPKQAAGGGTQAILHLGDAAHAALYAYLS